MCLAVPGEIIELLDDERALIDVGGTRHEISIAFIEDAKLGDYVLAHVGYALSRLDPEEAQKTIDLIEQMNAAGATEAARQS